MVKHAATRTKQDAKLLICARVSFEGGIDNKEFRFKIER